LIFETQNRSTTVSALARII